MLIFAILLLALAALLVLSSAHVVPAGTVTLVERLGRVVPVVRRPGLLFVRPFLERLLYFPIETFAVHTPVAVEAPGSEPLVLEAECRCRVVDVVRFHGALPFDGRSKVKEQAEQEGAAIAGQFLRTLLGAEGELAVRVTGATEFLGGVEAWAERLRPQIDERAESVGLRIEGLRVRAAKLSAKESWRLRHAGQS